jgi:G3E family GTPase
MEIMDIPVDRRPPVTVFCGFLGVGKTTLLRHLLGQAATAGREGGAARWAAVVNDVAAVNIDGALVGAEAAERRALGTTGAVEVVELGNGCVCCSGADDLGEAIARLADRGLYDHIWVETSGVADPRGVATLFTRKNPFGRCLADRARLAALVMVIDVVAFAEEAAKAGGRGRSVAGSGQRPVFEMMLEQIECADVVVLNQCDRVELGGADLERAEALVAGLNARAELVRTERGQISAEFFTERMRFDGRATLSAACWVRELNRAAVDRTGIAVKTQTIFGTPRHEAKYGITSFVYRARRGFDGQRLRDLFVGGLPGVLRAKGFFWTKEMPDEMGFVSVAGGVIRWEALSVWWAARIAMGRATLADRPESVVANWAEPQGDRRQEIVLIGVDMDQAALFMALDQCLAS